MKKLVAEGVTSDVNDFTVECTSTALGAAIGHVKDTAEVHWNYDTTIFLAGSGYICSE